MYSKDRIGYTDLSAENYVSVENLLQNKGGKKLSERVPTEGNVVGFVQGDILIGNIRPYLKKVWLADCDGGTNGDVLVVRCIDTNVLLPEFLYCILSSDSFFDFDNSHAKGAKMPRGDKDMILKYIIPIPPIEEQERIVSILDKFDALVNDISIGLPAEINARRQQYEYYRDKLLTFEEAA